MKNKILNTFIILCVSAVALLFAHGNMSKATIGFLQVTKNLTITAAGLFNAGSDGNGIDVQFFTDTATEEFLWDASANGLFLDGTNAANVLTLTDGNFSVTDDIDIDGVTNLDNVDIDGTFQLDNTMTVGIAGTSFDVQFFSATSGDHFLYDVSEERLTLIGTAGQDALLVSDGNISLTKDMNIDGVLTTDGINASSIIVVDSSPYAVLAANTGMIHTIADLGQNTSIDLPAEAAGLNYVFWYIGGADETHDHDIDTENNTNFFIGGVAFADTDAGSGADEINAGIYSDGDSNSKLTISNASAGTRVEVTCNGTNWFINGVIYSDTAPAFADQ